MKKISLKYIAEALDVSPALVSMVLNGKGDKIGISKKTQEIVLNKAKELNYTPNDVARSLRSGKSNTIGLVVADISNTFYSKIARNLEDLAAKQNYNLIICSSDESEEKEIRLVRMLKEKRVDGMIVSSTLQKGDIYKQLIKEGFPLVLFDRFFKNLETNYVGVDNYTGAFNAVNHLYDNGYRKLGILSVTPAYINSLNDRSKGFITALKANKVLVNNDWIVNIPFDNITNSITNTLKKWKENKSMPEALFIANNNIAINTLIIAKDLGINIPKDIAILSFDDIDLFQFSYVPITAISQPINKLCDLAFDLLWTNIQNREVKPEHFVLPTELIVRQSTPKKK